jgi:hypothetical protein
VCVDESDHVHIGSRLESLAEQVSGAASFSAHLHVTVLTSAGTARLGSEADVDVGDPSVSGSPEVAQMRDDVHMTAATPVPPYHELLWPALLAVDELGGSASIGETVEAVVKRERFTNDQRAVLHNEGPETEIGYRLAWARTYLKGMGLLTNSARGVWALTDAGAALLNDPTDERAKRERVRVLWSEHVAHLRSKDRRRKERKPPASEDLGAPDEPDWKTSQELECQAAV